MASNGTMTQGRKARKAQGWKHLVCPMCGEADVALTLDLSDLATLHCPQCENELSVSTAIKILTERLRQFEALAAWIAMAGEASSEADVESDATPDND